MSITVVSSRLFIRHKARGLAADDYFAGLSMLFALVYSILTVALVWGTIGFVFCSHLGCTLALIFACDP
ncbi:hypothetical protein HYQ44_020372 [Verticillium longisporum]|nr:hypothetical protein HYQ44_020372 [Verticillium longisporum]